MANKLTGDYAPEKLDVNVQMAATMALIAEIKELKRLKKTKPFRMIRSRGMKQSVLTRGGRVPNRKVAF